MGVEDTCFVISPIGSEGSETRERADKLFNYVIKPALADFDYDPVRADHIDEPGMITSQVIEYVVESPLVVADLTDQNPNVFYELAIRHALQKPTIQIIDSQETIPFDLNDSRTIQIDLSDLGSVESAKDEIQDQVNNFDFGLDDPHMDTPISVAMDLRNLRESSDPDERSIAEIMDAINDIRKEMRDFGSKLEDEQQKGPQIDPLKVHDVYRKTLTAREAGESLTTHLHQTGLIEEDPQIGQLSNELMRNMSQLEELLRSDNMESTQSLDDFTE